MKLLLNLFFVFMTIDSYPQVGQTILAKAELKNRMGCIDVKGNEIIPLTYDDMGFWGSNLIPVNMGAKKINYLKRGGKWGYCNYKGVLAIPIQYEQAETFYEGMAAVRLNKKWGFIDTTGKILIQPKYDKVRLFQGGLCAVSIKRKWGYINTKGEEVIKFQYGEADDFDNEVAVVFVGQITNQDWEEPVGKYCLINKQGKKICAAKFTNIWSFHDGVAKVEVKDTSDDYATKKGFINTKGEIIAPLIYDIAEDFSEGFAAVGMKGKDYKPLSLDDNYTYGYINTKGEEVIKLQFSRANKFKNGRAVVSMGKQLRMRFFVINSSDNSIENFENFPKYAVVDTSGNLILPFEWGALSPIDSNLFIAQRARFNGDGVIDISGKTVVPFNYTNLRYVGKNLFTANDGGGNEGEVQLITIENKILFKTDKFAMPATRYEFGLLHVRTHSLTKSGFVDINGKWIIKDKYDMVEDFESTQPSSRSNDFE